MASERGSYISAKKVKKGVKKALLKRPVMRRKVRQGKANSPQVKNQDQDQDQDQDQVLDQDNAMAQLNVQDKEDLSSQAKLAKR